jgi:hypothetical protein
MSPERDGSGEEARSRRQAAAERYRPAHVSVLLVSETPPSDPDRYFYFEDAWAQDALFRYVAKGILGAVPTRGNKGPLLADLRDRGVFLIDLKPEPADDSPLAGFVPHLVERCRELTPDAIILVKVTVYDAAYEKLESAHLPVVDERIPFPGSGQQRRFEETFARALEKASGQRGEVGTTGVPEPQPSERLPRPGLLPWIMLGLVAVLLFGPLVAVVIWPGRVVLWILIAWVAVALANAWEDQIKARSRRRSGGR